MPENAEIIRLILAKFGIHQKVTNKTKKIHPINMKKVLLAMLLCGFTAFTVSAQGHFCTTDEHSNAYLQSHPEAIQMREQLEQFTRQFAANRAQNRTSSSVIYTVPVVFHILHEYGNENISDAQVMDEIEWLNRDYNKLNPDTIDVIPEFENNIANIGFEFRLAQLDPNGNCTNGIEHIYTALTNSADDASKLNPWPNNKYLNIWVAKTLKNTAAAAYAYYPGAASASVDGIMCRYDYVGGIGASNAGVAHTITHEVGHYFNLAHPWGSTNSPGVACGDDNVSDTPETMGWTSCVLSGSICNPPIIENVQNFMDYSFCDRMFTEGQKTRMLAAINSSIGGRSNLWTPANLTATGLSGGQTLCTPVADFYYNHDLVCENGTVQFYDLSYNGTVASRSWSFPGGNPSTSVDSAPLVTYPTAGVYDVTLTSTNASGSDTKTTIATIRVSGATTETVPYLEGFDSSTTFPVLDGFVVNSDNATTWARATNTHQSGTACLKINNYTNVGGQVDEWVLPSFDFSNVTTPISMTFYVANAQRNSTSGDKLDLSISANCGSTFQLRWSKYGAALATAGVVSTNFTPVAGSATQWRQETINLNPFKLLPNIRLKFSNTSDRGNNTYLDEINITGTLVNVDEAEEVQLGFAIYPNPTSASSTVEFQLSKDQKVAVEIKDIMGRTVAVLANEQMTAGYHTLQTPALSKGIYMIDLISGNKHHVRRLIVS